MTAQQIQSCLHELDVELRNRGATGELCLYGGAAMCLVYQSRPATRDVDAIFQPSSLLREAASAIAERHDLPVDWLNDAVKGFVVEHGRRVHLDLPNLKVYVPDPQYLLAMKCLAARVDTNDADDVRTLCQHLGLSHAHEALAILAQYYPDALVRPATRFFLEELLGP